VAVHPPATPDPDPTTEATADPPAQLSRRERRAAARGGPAQKIAGPAPTRLRPPPARQRNYAARKSG